MHFDDEVYQVLKQIGEDIHQTAETHGFWGKYDSFLRDAEIGMEEYVIRQEQLVKLMLIVTELAEAAEGIRYNDPPDEELPEYSTLTVGLVDAIIRIIDLGVKFELPIFEAMLEKMTYNKGREKLHGKKL